MMIKKIVLSLTAATVSLAAACGGGTSTAPTNNANSNTAKTTPTPTAPKVDLSSPKATLTAFVEAVKKKDIEAIKATLSKNTLDIAKETGNGDANKAINDSLNENKGTIPASVETKDEKIEGDKATLQAKDADGKWIEAKFVKEGNDWKYDMFADMDNMGGKDNKSERGL
jgi:hypothetical protein